MAIWSNFVYFMVIWCILWSFWNILCRLVCSIKKNLATLSKKRRKSALVPVSRVVAVFVGVRALLPVNLERQPIFGLIDSFLKINKRVNIVLTTTYLLVA
jgi:hypothetical protein